MSIFWRTQWSYFNSKTLTVNFLSQSGITHNLQRYELLQQLVFQCNNKKKKINKKKGK